MVSQPWLENNDALAEEVVAEPGLEILGVPGEFPQFTPQQGSDRAVAVKAECT